MVQDAQEELTHQVILVLILIILVELLLLLFLWQDICHVLHVVSPVPLDGILKQALEVDGDVLVPLRLALEL